MQENRTPPLGLALLTGSRLLFALVVACMTPWLRGERWAIVVATALLIIIELSDVADGYLARRLGLVTRFGKLFDPYTDSLARITIFWSLAVAGRCLAFVPLLMAARDISVSYLRILMTDKGIDVAARWPGKLKALVQGSCGLLLMAGPLYWGGRDHAIIWALSFLVVLVTLASGLYYAAIVLGPSEGEGNAEEASPAGFSDKI